MVLIVEVLTLFGLYKIDHVFHSESDLSEPLAAYMLGRVQGLETAGSAR